MPRRSLKGENEDVLSAATTHSVEHLYKVGNSSKLIDKYAKQHFHTMTDKLVFISKGSRPNLQ